MPYFISDQTDCPDWAVVKEDDSVVACHDSKDDAIAQMVALSLAEDLEPGGERKINKKKLKYRAGPDELSVGDFVRWGAGDNVAQGRITRIVRDGEIDVPDSSFTITGTPEDPAALIRIYREGEDGWGETDTLVGHKFSTLNKIDELRAVTRELPDNYRPALAEDVPEGRACGNCFFFNEDRQNPEGTKAWCERWEDFVDGGYYCNAWEPDEEDRDIDQSAPAYMRAAARRGLEFHEQGLSGDGVTAGTIREARLMADGQVSDDKWIRIAAWIARHLVDLDAPDANPDSDNYPSAGVVAHLLWGSGPSKRAAQRTKDYADSVVARIRAEETNSMETKNKWLTVARAIQLKIDGPQPESKEPEVRTNSVDFEVRSEGDGMTFTGYASVFNSPSEDLGGFVEYVAPGAFKRSLQSRNEVKLLWNHDSGEPLASLRGGTMQLLEDERGLKVTAQLPNTTRGRDIAELLRTKVIDSMSFGFNVIKDSWSRDGQTRTLESVRLFEVSVVSFPAYEATVAQVRSAPSINADELADALLKLESGEELDEKNANLITEVVSKLKAQPEVQEAEDNGLSILDLKQKQFDLLMKRI
jgi:HK97 family phage prohead protease